MDRKKLEQVVLIVLIPVFLAGLLYMRSRTGTGLSAKYVREEISDIKEDSQIDALAKPDGPLDVEYESSKRDPLKDLLQVYIYNLQKKGPETKPEKKIPLPSVVIEGLIWNTDMPQAIANGKVVRIGDAIEGLKVVNIDKNGITVLHEGQPVLIPKK